MEGGGIRASRDGARPERLPRVCTLPFAELRAAPAQMLPRERKKAAYDAALVTRYAHMPATKRIAR